MTERTTHITRVGTVIIPVSDQDRALEFYLGTLGFEKRIDGPFGEGVPPMFTFRDPDGNRFRMVERD